MKNSNMINRMLILLALPGLLFLSACNNDDPEPENETELITRVTIKFTNQANPSEVVTAIFNDPDGPGGNPPTFQHPTLKRGVTYIANIELYNEIDNEDITEEIEEEDDEHQFFFIQSGNVFSQIAYEDTDRNGNPLGLKARFVTVNQAASGTLRVVLRHEPNKNNPSVRNGDITNAGGDTDLDIIFNITVQ
jgi:hypothetical protein